MTLWDRDALKRERFWLDTEFLEDGTTIDLLSIGIISEKERVYYAVSSDCKVDRANDWVKENVLPKIDWSLARPRKQIRHEINRYIGACYPEIWAYYADYDWVVFCWLFGRMIDLPRDWPQYCRDLKQLCDELGNPRLPAKPKAQHHALEDAKWAKQAWEFLMEFKRQEYDAVEDLLEAIRTRQPGYALEEAAIQARLRRGPRP